jgi:hypothetical protein
MMSWQEWFGRKYGALGMAEEKESSCLLIIVYWLLS